MGKLWRAIEPFREVKCSDLHRRKITQRMHLWDKASSGAATAIPGRAAEAGWGGEWTPLRDAEGIQSTGPGPHWIRSMMEGEK